MWPNSAEILPAAFANSGVTVVSFRPHSVEPSGAGFLYGYEVDTVDALGTTATVLTFIDTDAHAVDGSSVLTTDPGTGRPLAVWAYPADPMLPALAGVTFPDRVVESLAALGIVVTSPTLTVAAYRPGKRAVIRLDSAETTLFLKVIRPDRVAPIVDLHAAFRSRGVPVPAVLASRADGLLVLERVPGEPAGRHVLALADDPRFVDQLVEIGRLTATVPVVAAAQSDALDHGDWHRATLLGQLPRRGAEIDAVYAEIDRRRASWVGDPLTVIHGDLHLEQLFVDPAEPWRVTGVLDIDTAGWGTRPATRRPSSRTSSSPASGTAATATSRRPAPASAWPTRSPASGATACRSGPSAWRRPSPRSCSPTPADRRPSAPRPVAARPCS